MYLWFAVSLALMSRTIRPIGAKRNGRATIATIPRIAATAARALAIDSLFTAGDSIGLIVIGALGYLAGGPTRREVASVPIAEPSS